MPALTNLLSACALLLTATTTTAAPTNPPDTKILPPSSALPPPSDGLTLKYAALGLGHQNYTCPPLSSTSSTTAPVAIGAVADLYDGTALARTYSILSAIQLPTSSQSSDSYFAKLLQTDLLNRTSCAASASDSATPLRKIGDHYFTKSGVPTFDLSSTSSSRFPKKFKGQSLFLSAKKAAAVPAPSDACAGRDGGKAVPWLKLVDAADGTSEGLKEVYRVETSGGSAMASCEGVEGVVRREYAAFYYFYG